MLLYGYSKESSWKHNDTEIGRSEIQGKGDRVDAGTEVWDG